MGQITVYGTVPNFAYNEFYLPVDNVDELEKFWKEEKITTISRPIGGKPAIALRKKQFVGICKPGDRVKLTIESVVRKNGIGIKAVDLEII